MLKRVTRPSSADMLTSAVHQSQLNCRCPPSCQHKKSKPGAAPLTGQHLPVSSMSRGDLLSGYSSSCKDFLRDSFPARPSRLWINSSSKNGFHRAVRHLSKRRTVPVISVRECLGREVHVAALRIAAADGQRRAALGVVAFSQLFLLGIALAREFIGQLKRLESS